MNNIFAIFKQILELEKTNMSIFQSFIDGECGNSDIEYYKGYVAAKKESIERMCDVLGFEIFEIINKSIKERGLK